MKRLPGTLLALLLVAGPAAAALGDDKDPQAILDKAIQALGGEEKLKKAEAILLEVQGHHDLQRQRDGRQDPRHLSRPHPLPPRVRGRVRRERPASSSWSWAATRGGSSSATTPDARGGPRATRSGPSTSTSSRPCSSRSRGRTSSSRPPARQGRRQAGRRAESHRPRRQGLHPLLRQGERAARQARRPVPASRATSSPKNDLQGLQGLRRDQEATRIESQRDGEDFAKSEVTEFKILEKVDPKAFSEPS